MPIKSASGTAENGSTKLRQKQKQLESRGPPALPVDHGWAWMVMLGAFINNLVVFTFVRSTSLLFLPFLDKYKASATATTLALGLNQILFIISNALQPGFLLPRFSVRTINFFGGFLHALSILMIAFAPDVIVLNVAFAVNGFAQGLIYVPQMTLIALYFKNRLSRATAIVMLGMSIATVAGPPVTQLLLDMYGMEGAVLILAAINLHSLPASMLFRPVSCYASPSTDIVLNEVENEQKETTLNSKHPLCTEEPKLVLLDLGKIENKDSENERIPLTKEYTDDNSKLISGRVSTKEQNIQKFNDATKDGLDGELLKSLSERLLLEIPHGEKRTKYAVHNSLNSVHKSGNKLGLSQNLDIISTFASSISIGLSENERQRHGSRVIHERSGSQVRDLDGGSCLEKMNSKMRSSKFANPLVIIIIISTAMCSHTSSIFSYIPALAKENGLTKAETPQLLTVAGSCELLSKILIGLFGDRRLVAPITIVYLAQYVLGLTQQFVAFYQGLGLMMLMQVFVGLTTSVLDVLLHVLTVDLLGPELIGHVFSGFYLVNGGVLTLDHVVTGILKDNMGSFRGTYHVMGAQALIGATILLVSDIVIRWRKRQTFQEEIDRSDGNSRSI